MSRGPQCGCPPGRAPCVSALEGAESPRPGPGVGVPGRDPGVGAPVRVSPGRVPVWVSREPQAGPGAGVPGGAETPGRPRCGCPGVPRPVPGVSVPVLVSRAPGRPWPCRGGCAASRLNRSRHIASENSTSQNAIFYCNPAVLSVLHRFPPLGRLLAADFLTRFLRWMIRCLMGIFFWGVGGNYQMKYLPFSLPLALKRKKAALAVE